MAVSRVAKRIYGKNWTDIERPRLEADSWSRKAIEAELAGKTEEARFWKSGDAKARAEKVWPKGEPYYRRAQAIVLDWLAKEDLRAWEGVVPITPSFWSDRQALFVIEHGRKSMGSGMISVDETELGALLKELESSNSEKWGKGGGQRKRISPSLTSASQSKGGSNPKYNVALQEFINRLAAEFKEKNRNLTTHTLKAWLLENAQPGDGYEPAPPIPDCDDIEFDKEKLWWKDHKGSQKSKAIRSVERYISRAKNTDLNSTA
jgi:hypothetical protein